jgi:tripartite-type tricarboxylate transporter receptor subunit TctC
MTYKLALFYCFALALSPVGAPAAAQAQTDFFKGKTVTLTVGGAPGGGYDLYGRLLARHIGRHLPGNPGVVVTNVRGAQSIIAANFMANTAPKDGTAIAICVQNIGEEQLVGTEGVRYDAAQFGWVGRISPNVEIGYVWHSVPVKTVDDLKQRETIFASYGASAILYPTLLNETLGTRIKLVHGYSSSAAAHLALERGEAEGTTGSLSVLAATAADWVRDGKIKVLLQYQLERHPELPDVPAVMELVRAPEDRDLFSFFLASAAIGRSVFAPPGLSPARLEMLRTAFDQTMKDPAFIAEVRQSKVELAPLAGSELQALVARQISVSPALRARILALRLRQ